MIAIKANESGDVIFFDVVTQYGHNYQSQVTKHPVDGAGTISDHVVKQNPRITVKGVISGADFGTSVYGSSAFGPPAPLPEGVRSQLGTDKLYGEREPAGTISIEPQSPGLIATIAPGPIGQLIPENKPEVYNFPDEERKDSGFIKVLEGIRDSKEVVTLHEFDKPVIGPAEIVRDLPEKPYERIYLVGLNINEDAERGDAKVVTLTFETVVVTSLQQAVVPENTDSEVQEQTAEMESKGNVNSNAIDSGEGSGREPTLLQSLLGG